MLPKIFTFTFLFLCFSFYSFAQTTDDEFTKPNYNIKKTSSSIKIDGKLDELVWQEAETAGNFWQQAPVDDKQSEPKTEFQLSYDERFVYIAIKCYDDENHVIQTLKRDQFGNSDDIGVFFDPLNQQALCYAFGVNALWRSKRGLNYSQWRRRKLG